MLSVIILTKNEEAVIADCIESIKDLADEIIVIDSSSEDRTVDIAKHLGAKVFEHDFIDFSKARNFGIEQAKGDWVLYIDADEQATNSFIGEVKDSISHYKIDSSIGGYYIRRKTFYYGRDWQFIDKVQRLFYKKKFKEWHGVVHETPKISGEFGVIKSPILHYTHRNLSQMIAKTNEWSKYEAELRLKAKHPKMNSLRFIRIMITGFIQSYIYQNGYKNGTEGVIEAIYQSFSMFITYAKLWEKQNKKLQ